MRVNSSARQLLPRGVWSADYLVDGLPVLCAIDSHGNCVKRVKLHEDADEEAARAWLEGLLDHYDPQRPRLRLVRSERRRAAPSMTPGVFLRMLRR